jgi:hypothetical protein
MLKKNFIALFLLLLLFSNGSAGLLAELSLKGPASNTGTLEKMIVANGNVAMNLDLNRLNGTRSRSKESKSSELRFDAEPNSFFRVLVFNDELRGPMPGSMGLIPQNSAALPAKLSASYQQLAVENMEWGGEYDLAVRDAKTGFIFFNVEGQQFDYKASEHLLNVQMGRLLLSKEFAAALGRSSEAGTVVGSISITANMRAIEITEYVDGEVKADVLPTINNAGTVPGPDVVVGDLSGLAQFGSSSGTQVGLAIGTDSCNFGTVNLDWFALPDNNHPVIPQNLYRMSGGATNSDRFEQIGQSSVKHAFTALANNICGLGCNGTSGTRLGSGCSDPYSASLNAGNSNALGSRGWINPFTGVYPRGDGASNPNNHANHNHTGPSHRILTEMADLNTTLNAGATYYAEGQYITPHEYVWCQSNPTQCNMNNNVSYRQYGVTGTTSPFTFSPVAATVRAKTAITAWTGASFVEIKPDPVNDGIGTIGYKVTNPSPGVWHYEYAIYNQNLDRAIQSLGIPMGAGVTLSNVGFHAPPQHPGWTFDGTFNNAGFSSAPWTQTQAGGVTTWSSETFAQNQNANAVRWGTLYNIRFDSNRPPQTVNATVGFLKTGAPITVQIQGPSTPVASNVSVSGRVVTPSGQGIANATVSITDAGNNVRTYITGSFGYYNFDNVAAGGTYTIAVRSYRYTFAPQTLQVSNNVTDLNFLPTQAQ